MESADGLWLRDTVRRGITRFRKDFQGFRFVQGIDRRRPCNRRESFGLRRCHGSASTFAANLKLPVFCTPRTMEMITELPGARGASGVITVSVLFNPPA
jgi:hypothetical protein